jgi:hypothetical protein
LAYLDEVDSTFTLTRSTKRIQLTWPGVKITPSKLAHLLKQLPRERRIEGATRVGKRSASFSFDGKLRKSKLGAPEETGVVLLWTGTDLDLDPLEKAACRPFEPQGECLGKLTLKKGGFAADVRIFRSAELQDPGFVLLSGGRVVSRGGWLGFLDDEPSGRFCQVVVESDFDWEQGVPTALESKFRKLARLASQKSAELLETTEDTPQAASPTKVEPSTEPSQETTRPTEVIESLLETPRFLSAYANKKGHRPPVVTVKQILNLLWARGGQVLLGDIQEQIGLPESRLTEILSQMDSLLASGGEVVLSLSIDGTKLLLDQARLVRLFHLDAVLKDEGRTVRGFTLEGAEREVLLPIEISGKERRVVEALLRYGRLSEGELASLVGSRRVGGMLEKLISRLESEGYYGLAVAGEGSEGRVFEIQ